MVTVSDRSHVQGCLGHGLYVVGDHNSVDVLGGTIHENGGHGIFIWGNKNTLRIAGGEISSNKGYGVFVEGDDNVISVSDCRILNNDRRGLFVKGNHNKLEVTGGTILGRDGADLRMQGRGNTYVVTGGVLGDDGSGGDGQLSIVEHREKLLQLQALLCMEDDKTDDAMRHLCEAIRLNPEFASAYGSRGYLHRMQGDVSKALSDFDEAIRLNPQFALAYSMRGCIYWESDELPKAVRDFTKAIQLSRTPKLSLNGHRLRGTCLRTMGENARAVDDFLEATRLTFETFDPYIWRNDYYSYRLKRLSDAIEQDDGVTERYVERGCLLYLKGEFAKTVEDCTRAIHLDGDSPSVYVLRALAYERTNDNAEAAADYAKARELIENRLERHELGAIKGSGTYSPASEED